MKRGVGDILDTQEFPRRPLARHLFIFSLASTYQLPLDNSLVSLFLLPSSYYYGRL